MPRVSSIPIGPCRRNGPDTTRIMLVMDDFNPHMPSSLLQGFPLQKARRIVQKPA